MVLKIGPDRSVGPVQPPTGSIFGPIHYNEPPNHWIGHKLPELVVEPLDRTNQTVLDELNGLMAGLFPHVFFCKTHTLQPTFVRPPYLMPFDGLDP